MNNLPPGWKKHISTTVNKGRAYYERPNGTTTWNKPARNNHTVRNRNMPMEVAKKAWISTSGPAPMEIVQERPMAQQTVTKMCTSPTGLQIPCPTANEANLTRKIAERNAKYLNFGNYNDFLFKKYSNMGQPNTNYKTGKLQHKQTHKMRGHLNGPLNSSNTKSRAAEQAAMVPISSSAVDEFVQLAMMDKYQYRRNPYYEDVDFDKRRIEAIFEHFNKPGSGIRVDKETGEKYMSQYDIHLLGDLRYTLREFTEQLEGILAQLT